MPRISLRLLLLLTAAVCLLAAFLGYRERQQVALICEIESLGGSVTTQPGLIPGFSGVVTEVKVPHSVYVSDQFPVLSRFDRIEKFHFTNYEWDFEGTDLGLTSMLLTIDDPQAIEKVTERKHLQDY